MTARRTRDLVISTFTPSDRQGRAMRSYGVVAALARDRDVELLYKQFGAQRPAPAYEELAGVELHAVSPSRSAERALMFARARARGIPRADARGLSPELGRAARRAVAASHPDRVIADGPTAAALMMLTGVGFVYLAHNVETSLRPSLPQFRRNYGSARALRRFEAAVLRTARESWMVSRRDIALARELVSDARLRYVPNIVDVAAIRAADSAPPGPPSALFVGDFSYPPNVRAASLLVNEVMPRVWSTMPEAELIVVGRGMDRSHVRDPRVRILGFVPRIEDAYDQAACVVVPLLESGGSPLKFVEALAHGLPVVATDRAAAGLEVEEGVHYRGAEGAQGLAEAVVDVLRGGAWEMAVRGRRLAESAYSIEALAAILSPQEE